MSALPRALSSVRFLSLLAAPLATACIVTTPPAAVGPVAGPPTGRNLLVNGGFEDPSIAPGTWSELPGLPGWRVIDGGVVEVQNRVAGEPASGAQLVELDGDRSAAIAQDVATRRGARYRLSYRFSARPGTGPEDNRLEVRWNGAVVDQVSAAGDPAGTRWVDRVVEVDGVDGVSRLELIDRGRSDGNGTYVDDVALVDLGGQPVIAAPPPVELVVNGGFEQPELAGGTWNVFTDIPGWHTTYGPGVEVQNHVAGDPASGAQHIELDSHASSAIAQDLPTHAGGRYRVTYRFAARPGSDVDDNRLEVRWSGNVIDQVDAVSRTPNTEWITRTVDVDTWHDGDRLELIDRGRSNGVGTYVDDVSVVQIGAAVAQ